MSQLRTPEEKAKIVNRCIDLEMEGGDVLGCLQAEGYVTPKATWQNLQRIYLGRSGDKLTDGHATGHKRKGKRPEIRQDALERDRAEWERVHATVQTAPEPETVQTEQEPVCTEKEPEPVCTVPQLVSVKVKGGNGYWERFDDGTVQLWADPAQFHNALRLSVDDWKAVIREFPEVCRLMGLGK